MAIGNILTNFYVMSFPHKAKGLNTLITFFLKNILKNIQVPNRFFFA